LHPSDSTKLDGIAAINGGILLGVIGFCFIQGNTVYI
jgi:hypothetical protein